MSAVELMEPAGSTAGMTLKGTTWATSSSPHRVGHRGNLLRAIDREVAALHPQGLGDPLAHHFFPARPRLLPREVSRVRNTSFWYRHFPRKPSLGSRYLSRSDISLRESACRTRRSRGRGRFEVSDGLGIHLSAGDLVSELEREQGNSRQACPTPSDNKRCRP